MKNEDSQILLKVVEDFKNGYAKITDVINALGVDLLDCDIEDLKQYIDNFNQ